MAKYEGLKRMGSLESREEKVNDLKVLLKNENLEFTADSDWEALVDHIEVHKYFIDMESSQASSWDEAVASWNKKVYSPLIQVADWWEVKKAFKKYTKGQLLFAISSHWYYMMEKDSDVTPADAANSFAASYGRGLGQWISQKKLDPPSYYV